MASELPLFAYTFRRDADPPRYRAGQTTSKLAADELVKSGALHAQQAFVLGVVKASPGHTALELDKLAGTDRVFGRRLSELERRGLVRRGEPRQCAIGKRAAVTWWPA